MSEEICIHINNIHRKYNKTENKSPKMHIKFQENKILVFSLLI